MTLTAEQMAARKIGSSDAAVAAGVDPWREPYGWWMERTGRSDPTEETLAMRVGTYMEPLLRDLSAEALGKRVSGPQEITETDWAEFATANLDATLEDEGLTVPLELKTASVWTADKWGESGSDEIPVNYVIQVTHQMAVTGAPFCYVAALIGNADFRWYRLARDERLVEHLHRAESRLWQHVVDDIPPTPETLAGCAMRWPNHDDGKVYELTAPEWQTLQEMQAAGERKKLAEAEEKAAKLRLVQAAKDAETLIYDMKPVATYRADKRGRRALRLRKNL
jgi:putative phage-type endonuclease